MSVHHLASLTWEELERLARGRVVAILPTGAIEAHGPHLPLGTDVVIAEAMARVGANRLSDAGLDVVVLPSLPFTSAPFAAAFAGTLNAPSSAVTSIVTAIARDVARHGVRLTAIANAHHDPAHVAALRSAVEELDGIGNGMRLVFPDLTRRRWAERLTEEFRSGACHAGRYETSILLAERPELVHADLMTTLSPNPRSLVEAIRAGHTTFAEAGGPDAYFGWPADASASEGHAIVEQLGAILCDAVLEHL
jgi:creatinine amidohydrolase